jgi:plasmid stability protein
MPNVLVRNVPKKTLDTLRKRAAARQRSLQQELRLLLDREAQWASIDYVAQARRIRERIAKYAPRQTDSAVLIREDRQRDHVRR